jgi:hypothetical protein
MKSIISLTSSFYLFLITHTYAQSFAWANQVGTSGWDIIAGTVADGNGNNYSIGSFFDTLDFDPGPGVFTMAPTPGNKSFLLKLDASGNFVWVNQSPGNKIALDPSGNIFLLGRFTQTFDFDPGPGSFDLTSYGMNDVFLLKLDPSGNFLWAKQFGGPGEDEEADLKIGPGGDVFLGGTFSSTADFDPGNGIYNLTASGLSDIFLTKLDNSGNLVWANRMGNSGSEYFFSAAFDKNDNLVISGQFSDSIDADPGQAVNMLHAPPGQSGRFVVKLGPQENYLWGDVFPVLDMTISSICTTLSGNIKMCGWASDTCDFDPGPGVVVPTSTVGQESFILTLDTAGTFSSVAELYDANGNISLNLMSIDQFDNIYLTGVHYGTIDIDPGPAVYNTPSGSSDYVMKYSPSGNLTWYADFGSFFGPMSLWPDAYGSVMISGFFNGTADFNPGPGTYPLTSVGNRDAFILKLNQPVGMNEYTANPLVSLFPNPSDGKVNITANEPISDITVLNSCGEIVYRSNPGEKETQLDLSGLSRSIYFCSIRTGEACTFKKIIIHY